ncbi:hypothetical protein C0389_06800 [bacterium]|nr:hypothetical protein [bacterium]
MSYRTKWGDHKTWGTFQWLGNGVKINGVITDIYDLVIDDILTNEVNTCSFSVIGDYTNKPIEGTAVEVWYQNVKIFAGRIKTVSSHKLNNTNFEFYCICSDYTCDLDKRLVVESYEEQTLNYIVNDIISKYTTGFTTNNVDTASPIIDYIAFNYETTQECFRRIAEATAYDWYVDEAKDIHFFSIDSPINNAPIELLDNGTEFDGLQISVDKTQIKNRVIVRGGYYLSNEYTQTIVADGQQTEFLFAYYPHDTTVKVNTVSKTIGIENIDAEGTHDFLMNYSEKTLKNDTLAKLSAGDILEMKYKFEIPVLCQVDDIASQNAIIAIESGDGIFEFLITDENLVTIESARERGNAELKLYANVLVNGTFTSHYNGWKSGQRLHIKLTDRNIDAYYLIKKVTTQGIGGDQMIYIIEFATLLLGFTWLLLKLIAKINKVEVRTDEVLNKLYVVPESVSLTDTVTATLFTPPYKWSNDAGTTVGKLKWELGEWA